MQYLFRGLRRGIGEPVAGRVTAPNEDVASNVLDGHGIGELLLGPLDRIARSLQHLPATPIISPTSFDLGSLGDRAFGPTLGLGDNLLPLHGLWLAFRFGLAILAGSVPLLQLVGWPHRTVRGALGHLSPVKGSTKISARVM